MVQIQPNNPQNPKAKIRKAGTPMGKILNPSHNNAEVEARLNQNLGKCLDRIAAEHNGVIRPTTDGYVVSVQSKHTEAAKELIAEYGFSYKPAPKKKFNPMLKATKTIFERPKRKFFKPFNLLPEAKQSGVADNFRKVFKIIARYL